MKRALSNVAHVRLIGDERGTVVGVLGRVITRHVSVLPRVMVHKLTASTARYHQAQVGIRVSIEYSALNVTLGSELYETHVAFLSVSYV